MGEAVVALCAESPAQAADACELVEVDYEPLAADRRRRVRPGSGRSAPPRRRPRQCALSPRLLIRRRGRGFRARAHRAPRDLQPRALLSLSARGSRHRRRVGRGPAHRMVRHAGAAYLPDGAGPRVPSSGGPRAGGRAGHRRRLRPEDARPPRGRGGGGARAGRGTPGEVDRDAAREPGGRLASPRRESRDRGGRGSRRRSPRPSRARRRRQRRLSHPSIDCGPRAAGDGLHSPGSLPHAGVCLGGACRRHQQAAARRLSRRRHDHGRLRHGAHARSLRRTPRARSRRDPPPQPDPARRLSVHLSRGLRLRQRRLSKGARDGARARRL